MLRRRLMNVARFARSAPTPCYQRDNAPPFASVPLFPDVFACTPRFLLSSPFFSLPPSSPSEKRDPRGRRLDCVTSVIMPDAERKCRGENTRPYLCFLESWIV